MTKDFIKEEKKRIAGMLKEYNKNLSDITEEMAGIDAKYKALAKQEKEALSAALSVYKDLIKGATKLYASLGGDEEPVIPDETKQVVDTLFPDNNKEENIPDVEEKEEDIPNVEEEDIEVEEEAKAQEEDDEDDDDAEDLDEEDEGEDDEDEWEGKVDEEW